MGMRYNYFAKNWGRSREPMSLETRNFIQFGGENFFKNNGNVCEISKFASNK